MPVAVLMLKVIFASTRFNTIGMVWLDSPAGMLTVVGVPLSFSVVPLMRKLVPRAMVFCCRRAVCFFSVAKSEIPSSISVVTSLMLLLMLAIAQIVFPLPDKVSKVTLPVVWVAPFSPFSCLLSKLA